MRFYEIVTYNQMNGITGSLTPQVEMKTNFSSDIAVTQCATNSSDILEIDTRSINRTQYRSDI